MNRYVFDIKKITGSFIQNIIKPNYIMAANEFWAYKCFINNLKKVLKKMNDATVRIISDYTPKPKKMLQHSNTAITTLALQEK